MIVTSSAPSNELAMFGLGFRGHGQFWAVPFINASDVKSSTAIYPGVPTSQSPAFGPESFKLQAAIANFGDRPRKATILLLSAGTRGQKELVTVTVPPRRVAVTDLEDLVGGPGSAASLVVQGDDGPNELLTNIQAMATSGVTVLSLPLPWKDQDQRPNGGQHPWRADGAFSSTLFLFNPDPGLENSVRLSVYAGGEVWVKRVLVSPLATVAVRLNDVIARQEPDELGRTLPRDRSQGFLVWHTVAKAKIFGYLAQTDGASGVVRPFACPETYSICGAALGLHNMTLDSGGSNTVGVTPKTCPTSLYDCQCYDTCANDTASPDYAWSTGDSSIATRTSASTDSTGTYLGAAGGSTIFSVVLRDTRDSNCTGTDTGDVAVNVPVALSMDVTSYTINKQNDTQDVVATVSAPSGALTATGVNITVSASVANPGGVQFSQNPASGQCSLTLNTGQTSQNCTLTLTTSQTNPNSGTLTITFTAAPSGGQPATISGSPKTATVNTVP